MKEGEERRHVEIIVITKSLLKIMVNNEQYTNAWRGMCLSLEGTNLPTQTQQHKCDRLPKGLTSTAFFYIYIYINLTMTSCQNLVGQPVTMFAGYSERNSINSSAMSTAMMKRHTIQSCLCLHSQINDLRVS